MLMNVRSMFVKFSVCLQGVFHLDLDMPRSRLSVHRPAAAHTSGAEAQPKVRWTEAPCAAPAPTAAAPQPAPTAAAAELAPPALAVNDHSHPPQPDGLQDPQLRPPYLRPPCLRTMSLRWMCLPLRMWRSLIDPRRPICLLKTTMTMSSSRHLRCQLLGQHLLPKFLTAPSR